MKKQTIKPQTAGFSSRCKAPAVSALVLWSLVAVVLPAFGAFEEVTPERQIAGLTETVWVNDVADAASDVALFERIGLHRYQGEGKPQAVMLYLPGTNMNGEMAITDENHNLWVYLARRNVVVYTLDYRTHFIPNDYAGDLKGLRRWTMDTFVADSLLAVDFIRAQHQQTPLFLAGFSRGASYAYGVSGQRDLAGLVVLDGSFKDYRSSAYDLQAALLKLDDSKEYVSILSRARGWESRTRLMQLGYQDPEAPGLDNRYETVADQLESTLYNAWGKGGLTNPVDGISSIKVLARMMEGYDRFFPAVQNIEGRSVASQDDDPATPLDDRFGSVPTPVIYFGSTNLGADNLLNGIYSASSNGSKDVTINVLENYGHVDVLVGEQAAETVFKVIHRWINARTTP